MSSFYTTYRTCVCTLLFALVFLGAGIVRAEAATLSLSPGTGVYTAGATFTATVILNTQGAPVNAADATLSFNPNEVSVVGVSRTGSIFNLWTTEPTFSNSAGTISFGGGSPSGYTGGSGAVMSVTFKAINAGTARVSFKNGSVLAADGKGTNVLSNMSGGTYTFVAQEVQPVPEVIEYVAPANTPGAPTVRSNTHPDPSKWYKESTAQLSWTIPSGVTGVRTLLDGNSGSIPTKVYETPISSIELPDLTEGVSYFHIQFRNADGWGRVAHYRLAVDTEKPTSFDISIAPDVDPSKPEQTLLLEVQDDTSPVRRFAVQLDGAEPYEYIDETGSSTITLPALEPGHHTVIIEAFDAAGNSIISTFSFDIIAFDKPLFTEYPTQINEEVIPVIKGLTKPRATVEVTLKKQDGTPVVSKVIAGDDGVFIYIPDGTLNRGVYSLSAIAIDTDGARSEPSDTIRIAVQQPGYVQIGSFIISILSIIIPLIALLVLLVVGLWYLLNRIRRFRRRVAIESTEALDILRSQFAVLYKTLRDEEQALIEAKKTKKLTKSEAHLIEQLDRSLQDTQARIEKEITDVTALVKKQK